MLFTDLGVFFTLAMFPERLGVAGAFQNSWTREEESAWGRLSHLVYQGSDAARYWDFGSLLWSVTGLVTHVYSLRRVHFHNASNVPSPLMSG